MRWRACLIFVSLMAAAAAAAYQVGRPEDGASSSPAVSSTPAPRHPVTVSRPAGPPRVDTGLVDATGQPITAACSTCHATREPNPDNRTGDDLDEFHAGLSFVHGTLACLSCHDGADYDRLRLADGTRVPYPEVMTLCGQCHGRQVRDYEHGAHGGMTGYWDLTRGPRRRHGCIDCHDPHAPAFPTMLPMFKPVDRFLSREAAHE